jgi:hypothetical protein
MAEVHDPNYNKLPEYGPSRAVTITTIIACTVLLLACLLACVIVSVVFFMNAPWA